MRGEVIFRTWRIYQLCAKERDQAALCVPFCQ